MPDELTDAEIQEILARAEAATPGPWEEQRHDDSTCAAVYVIAAPTVPNLLAKDRRRGDLHRVTSVCCSGCSSPECPTPTNADAAFIAAARVDVPLLARALLSAYQERDQLRERMAQAWLAWQGEMAARGGEAPTDCRIVAQAQWLCS